MDTPNQSLLASFDARWNSEVIGVHFFSGNTDKFSTARAKLISGTLKPLAKKNRHSERKKLAAVTLSAQSTTGRGYWI